MNKSGDDTRVMQGIFLKVVQEHLKKNDPPETKQTLQRLLGEGIPERDAMNMLALCVANEFQAVLEEDGPFNKERFVKMLNELPGEFL